jgi:hypothetical protein
MNERLRELAEQATTYIEPTSNSGEGWIFDKEKFAKLIVKECAKNAYNVFDAGFPQHLNDPRLGPENFYDVAAFTAFKVVEQTFGDQQ